MQNSSVRRAGQGVLGGRGRALFGRGQGLVQHLRGRKEHGRDSSISRQEPCRMRDFFRKVPCTDGTISRHQPCRRRDFFSEGPLHRSYNIEISAVCRRTKMATDDDDDDDEDDEDVLGASQTVLPQGATAERSH